MNNDLTTLSDRITTSLVVCVMSKENITKGNVYVVEESYVCASNIPCVAVIGDNGKTSRYYQTYFKAADMSKFDVKMSVEEAATVVDNKIEECYVKDDNDWLFVSNIFITKIQHDKELQKALLVLIGESK